MEGSIGVKSKSGRGVLFISQSGWGLVKKRPGGLFPGI